MGVNCPQVDITSRQYLLQIATGDGCLGDMPVNEDGKVGQNDEAVQTKSMAMDRYLIWRACCMLPAIKQHCSRMKKAVEEEEPVERVCSFPILGV